MALRTGTRAVIFLNYYLFKTFEADNGARIKEVVAQELVHAHTIQQNLIERGKSHREVFKKLVQKLANHERICFIVSENMKKKKNKEFMVKFVLKLLEKNLFLNNYA